MLFLQVLTTLILVVLVVNTILNYKNVKNAERHINVSLASSGVDSDYMVKSEGKIMTVNEVRKRLGKNPSDS